MTMYSDPERPVWFQKKKVDEVLFCEELLEELPMICIHDSFFTVDGKVTDEGRIKNLIYEKLKPFVRSGLSRKVTTLLDTLRSECYSPPLPVHSDRIHVANGTFYLDGHFEETKSFCSSLGSSTSLTYSASGTGRFSISAVCTSAASLNRAISSGRLKKRANLVFAR